LVAVRRWSQADEVEKNLREITWTSVAGLAREGRDGGTRRPGEAMEKVEFVVATNEAARIAGIFGKHVGAGAGAAGRRGGRRQGPIWQGGERIRTG